MNIFSQLSRAGQEWKTRILFFACCLVMVGITANAVPIHFASAADEVPPTRGIPPGGDKVPPQSNIFQLKNPLSSQYTTVGGLIKGFVEIFSYLAVLFGVLALIWVGFKMVLARGNVTEAMKAKDQLIWVVVGIAVVLSARVIITVVINTLEASGTVNPNVIQKAKDAVNN